MLITCDKCRATYSIAEKIIGPKGRTVKCANCNNSWMVEVEATSTKSLVTHKSHAGFTLKILATLFVFLNILLILMFFSNSLIQYKPLEKFYNYFSIHNIQGLSIREISFKKYDNEIIVEGKLYNSSNENRFFPNIRYTILDKEKKEILSFTPTHSNEILPPLAKLDISARIMNPEDKAYYLQIEIGNKLDLLTK